MVSDTGRAVAMLGLLVALAACRRDGVVGQGPYGDKVATLIPQIERSVGVKFKRPPKVEVRSPHQVREFLLRQFDATDPRRELEGEQATYKLLGMIPDTLDLRKFLVDLLTEQVIGYYDPTTKVLYVVQGAPDDLVGTTITHELVHALQDQYVNLDSLQHVTGDDDRQSAAQAVIEGEAVYEQMSIMLGGNDNLAARLGGWDRVRDLIRENQGSQPIFSAAPLVIQESLLFPYINGADFVRRFKALRPGRLPFDSMPTTTEQVMHERAYFGTPRVYAIPISLPAVANGVYQNDLGEFGTRLFLFQHLKEQSTAIRAAAGWRGDRYVVVRTGDGNAIAWMTVWDTPVDAAEFVTAAGEAMAKRYGTSAPATAVAGRRTLEGRGRIVQITEREIDGQSVVLFVDAPARAGPNLFDLAKVRLGARP